MSNNFILKFIFLMFIGTSVIGCSQPIQEGPAPTLTHAASPTIIQTLTSTPQPTDTIEPTSTPTATQTNTPLPPKEVAIQEIPLAGPIAIPKAQISGMAWHGDTLIMLPQYPEKEPALGTYPSVFTLEKDDVISFIEGRSSEPLIPTRLSFLGGALESYIPGYEGYEAIAIDGDKIFLTIEANDNGSMAGYLVEGTYLVDQNSIQIDPSSLAVIPIPVQIFNYAYESLIVSEDELLMIYEANGVELNPDPYAIRTDNTLDAFLELGFDNIEYRMTDATRIDDNGRFWVLNIFMPIEFWLFTDSDPIFENFGKGATHSENLNVERLLELQYNGEEAFLTETEPIQLVLDGELNARNWEALVVLDDIGFLAMTDTYPDTILAFIPFPNK